MRIFPILLVALGLTHRPAVAQDLVIDGHPLLALERTPDGVTVRVLDHARVATHFADQTLIVVMTNRGQLFAADVKPRLDGTLPELRAALVADLGQAIGDLGWWTPLLGALSAEQAATANANAGDLVVAKEDLEAKYLVTILPRQQIESEIECLRALSYN